MIFDTCKVQISVEYRDVPFTAQMSYCICEVIVILIIKQLNRCAYTSRCSNDISAVWPVLNLMLCFSPLISRLFDRLNVLHERFLWSDQLLYTEKHLMRLSVYAIVQYIMCHDSELVNYFFFINFCQ